VIQYGWFHAKGDQDIKESSKAKEGNRIVSTSFPDQKNVVLGIRAEDISVTDPQKGAIQGTVFATENTGESIMITISQTIGLQFIPEKTYFFDKDSGLRLR